MTKTTQKPKISVALATFNEAENIGRCLESVVDWVDEIVIVDGSSTDNTREIAKQYGAKIITTTNKPIFHINKQMAVEKSSGDWILSMDADEQVSPELAQEIIQVINMTEAEIRNRNKSLNPKKWQLFDRHLKLVSDRDNNFDQSAKETVAFFVPRLNMFLGHPMRYTGVYPDGVIRLFKKGKAKYPAKSVHEQIQVKGRVDWLTADLIHYDSPTFAKYLMRSNRYTSLTAKELAKNKTKIALSAAFVYLIYKPTTTFLNLYLRHKGFRDGFAGFVFSLMSGLHFATAYLKFVSYQLNPSKTND